MLSIAAISQINYSLVIQPGANENEWELFYFKQRGLCYLAKVGCIYPSKVFWGLFYFINWNKWIDFLHHGVFPIVMRK